MIKCLYFKKHKQNTCYYAPILYNYLIAIHTMHCLK